VLCEVARVLRPAGLVVLDLLNPARVRAELVPESRSERGGLVILERRSLDRAGTRVVKEVCLREPGGTERRWREDVRLYERAELEDLLARSALTCQGFEGDFDGRASAPDAPRQIVWARKR